MSTHIHSLHYPLAVDAALGRLAEEQDYAEHVKELILQVLMTAPGERINLPEFGCGIRQMVFAPNSEVSASLAEVTVHQALNRYLDSVIEVSQVKVTANESTLEVEVSYLIKANLESRYLNVEVPR